MMTKETPTKLLIFLQFGETTFYQILRIGNLSSCYQNLKLKDYD